MSELLHNRKLSDIKKIISMHILRGYPKIWQQSTPWNNDPSDVLLRIRRNISHQNSQQIKTLTNIKTNIY
jgi:hypothetical protein